MSTLPDETDCESDERRNEHGTVRQQPAILMTTVVYKQVQRKGEDGQWHWEEPYVYALTSNSRSAIALCEFATAENPSCRMFKMGIPDSGRLPDPERVGDNSRDYFRRKHQTIPGQL